MPSSNSQSTSGSYTWRTPSVCNGYIGRQPNQERVKRPLNNSTAQSKSPKKRKSPSPGSKSPSRSKSKSPSRSKSSTPSRSKSSTPSPRSTSSGSTLRAVKFLNASYGNYLKYRYPSLKY